MAAPTETVLHSFAGGSSDGSEPSAGLIADGSGNLYGTTAVGGAAGFGVVFKLAPSGTETVLHSFAGGTSDGSVPIAGLIADSAGNLYGTTIFGGASGLGVVFKLTPSGTETVLHSFAGGSSDGSEPSAGLIADSAGNLYGTTVFGGGSNLGTVFKLPAAGGTATVLHSFAGGSSDGDGPRAGLIADGSGNLYGTTEFGGALNFGVVFKLTPSGTATVLHTFAGGTSDGSVPIAGLIADSAGNLYGTTLGHGAAGVGVVFKLTPSGTETVLHSFAGSDGSEPAAGLIADSSGNLYGTTSIGGASGFGVVFKLTPSGTETVLYSFAGGTSDGAQPFAGLIADGSGNLYGTTEFGGGTGCGGQGCGVVFKLAGTGFVTAPPTAPPTLQVSGPATIVANAAQGGAAIFSPSSFDYTLSATNGSVQVSILASGFPPGIPAWLNPSITSASVMPGTPVADPVSLINLGTLARGTYNATVSFTNTTNHQGDTMISATLRIYNKNDCKKGGWKNFISPPGPFPNQGTCVTYFANLAP